LAAAFCSEAVAAGAFAAGFFELRLAARFAAALRRSDPERVEAERFFALGFFELLERRREGGRLSASPPPLPPQDRLAMTPTGRGQGEPTEDQRASNQTESEQVSACEGELTVASCGVVGSRAVAGSVTGTVTSAVAAVATTVTALATGTLGAATVVGGGSTVGRTTVPTGGDSVALGARCVELQQRAVAAENREHIKRLANTVGGAGRPTIGVVRVAHRGQKRAQGGEIGVGGAIGTPSRRDRNTGAGEVDHL
jgi:hypothetical protein